MEVADHKVVKWVARIRPSPLSGRHLKAQQARGQISSRQAGTRETVFKHISEAQFDVLTVQWWNPGYEHPIDLQGVAVSMESLEQRELDETASIPASHGQARDVRQS